MYFSIYICTFHKQSPAFVCVCACAHLQHFLLRSSRNKMDARVNRYLLQSVTLLFEPHWREKNKKTTTTL